jgi:hypothetical protein
LNEAKEIFDQAKQRGCHALDAPVSGGSFPSFQLMILLNVHLSSPSFSGIDSNSQNWSS